MTNFLALKVLSQKLADPTSYIHYRMAPQWHLPSDPNQLLPSNWRPPEINNFSVASFRNSTSDSEKYGGVCSAIWPFNNHCTFKIAHCRSNAYYSHQRTRDGYPLKLNDRRRRLWTERVKSTLITQEIKPTNWDRAPGQITSDRALEIKQLRQLAVFIFWILCKVQLSCM